MRAGSDGSDRVVEYRPGNRWLIAGDRAVIQLAGAASDAMRWWPGVRGGASAGVLIEQIHADGVLGAGHALSIVVVEGDAVRVLAQGDATVTVETVAGEQVTVSGHGLLTWAEMVVQDAAVVHLGPDLLSGSGDLLPMPTGVVQVGPVRWQLVPPTTAVAARPSPAAETTNGAITAVSGGAAGTHAAVDPDAVDLDFEDPDVDEAVTVIAIVPSAARGTGDVDNAVSDGAESAEAASAGADYDDDVSGDTVFRDTAPPDAAVPDTVVPEPAADDNAFHDNASGDNASHDTVPPVVGVSHAEVTQTVTGDDWAELADRDAGAGADDQADDQRAEHPHPDRQTPDDQHDDQQLVDQVPVDQVPADDDGTSLAGDDLEASPLTIDATLNPFPSMALPPFVPPSFGSPPFTPPDWSPPTFGAPPADLPPVSAPPFVPISTSLPPISAVPGATRDQDSVPTGFPPVEPTREPIPGTASTSAERSAEKPAEMPTSTPAAQPTATKTAPATRTAASTPAPAGSQDHADGDHDGHTQLAESLPAGYRPPPVPPAPQDGEVYAALCPYGHPNEPHSGNCRVCGSPITAGEPVLTARPLLGRIRLSSGPSVDIDRRIVIGRAPSVSRVAATEIPRLVTVSSPNQDISRSHVEVRSEDWNLIVTDLHSTNGTVVKAPDRKDQLLHPGQSMVVDLGWTVDLGDGVSFVVEAAS